MMLHLFKYRFMQTIRQFDLMFWALLFPIILGTLFYLTFGRLGLASTGEANWREIKVAVVKEGVSSENAKAFDQFLAQLDGGMLDIQETASETEAIDALGREDILGIFYVRETPSLTVGKSGINESILTALLESYNRNSAMFRKIAEKHPENLGKAIPSFATDYRQTTHEVSLGGKSMDPNTQYFFALIAYACLSGTFLGIQSGVDGQANLSALGARRSITPTHKLWLILTDLLVLFVIHFINILILCLYVSKVLKVSLGDDIASLLLVDFMGSMIGICIGIVLGCVSRLSSEMKIGLGVLVTLLPGFLAGLMYGNMKNILELHCPIVNRLNPAAVLSDAYYCISIYPDRERFTRCMVILAVMCVVLLAAAFLRIRRERYDSI